MRPTPKNASIAVGLKFPGVVSLLFPASIPMLNEGVSEADVEVGKAVLYGVADDSVEGSKGNQHFHYLRRSENIIYMNLSNPRQPSSHDTC